MQQYELAERRLDAIEFLKVVGAIRGNPEKFLVELDMDINNAPFRLNNEKARKPKGTDSAHSVFRSLSTTLG